MDMAKQVDLEHKAIPSGRRMKDNYHIQHINAFHSNFKFFLQKIRDVSTKHLHSYLTGFKWIELFKDEKELLRIQKPYIQSQASYSIRSNKNIKRHNPQFI